MRKLKLNNELALLLSALRREAGIEEVHDLRLEGVELVEEKFDFRIPDAILAYYASELAGRVSTPKTSPRAMIELTRAERDEIIELSEQGYAIRS